MAFVVQSRHFVPFCAAPSDKLGPERELRACTPGTQFVVGVTPEVLEAEC